jgi:5,10-methylenetetrahydrofolate reductase
VFTLDQFRRLRDEVAPLPVRLFPGVMPMASLKNAQFMASGRIPGIEVPESLVSRFEAYASPDDQRKFGAELATELLLGMRSDGAAGAYVIMPFGKHSYQDTAAIVRSLRAADT